MYVMQPTVLPFFVNMPEGELIKIDYIDDDGTTIRKDVISLLAKYYHRPKGGDFGSMGITKYLAEFTIGAKQTKPPPDKSKKWLDGYGHLVSKRVREKTIPRFQTLLPSAGEVRLFQHVVNMLLFVHMHARHFQVYYLQMILKADVPLRSTHDAYVYEDQNGKRWRCQSLQRAALRRGLYTQESEYMDVFRSQVNKRHPSSLRTLLVHCTLQGANGYKLFEESKLTLMDDIEGADLNEKEQICLNKLALLFDENNRDIRDFNFPAPELHSTPLTSYNPVQQLGLFDSMQLDDTQRGIVSRCVNVMKEHSGHTTVLFIDAAAGYGKTHLARAISRQLRALSFVVYNVANTALAATLSDDGTTAHYRYKIPVSDNPHVTSTLSAQSLTAQSFASACHIWDEAPNSHAKNIECFEKLLRDVGNSDEQWGGAPLVIFMGGRCCSRLTAPFQKICITPPRLSGRFPTDRTDRQQQRRPRLDLCVLQELTVVVERGSRQIDEELSTNQRRGIPGRSHSHRQRNRPCRRRGRRLPRTSRPITLGHPDTVRVHPQPRRLDRLRVPTGA